MKKQYKAGTALDISLMLVAVLLWTIAVAGASV